MESARSYSVLPVSVSDSRRDVRVEQPGAEQVLELVEVAGDVGRRGVELVRGAGEAALADHGGENLESP
jgi:hypothetical protein